MLRSENARLSGWVYVDIRGRDLKSAVRRCSGRSREKVQLPPGYSVSWSGQFEFLERATAKLKVVVPFTLLIIFVLLYLTFRRFDEALLIMATLPFALVGGIWLLWLLATTCRWPARGLHRAGRRGGRVRRDHAAVPEAGLGARSQPARRANADLLDAIREGAVLRVRPKAMTVAVILAGLLPDHVGRPAPARK
jgi:Cu(I)/Ag(I) efflux system membrane protein CusA/SilA